MQRGHIIQSFKKQDQEMQDDAAGRDQHGKAIYILLTWAVLVFRQTAKSRTQDGASCPPPMQLILPHVEPDPFP